MSHYGLRQIPLRRVAEVERVPQEDRANHNERGQVQTKDR
ncbi:MAG: hypothetical protein RL073_383, partial [Actinomycetota bacterium]